MEEVLQALSVLEKIEPGQKLKFKGGVAIDENPSRINRWLSGENKDATLKGLVDIIERAMKANVTINNTIVFSLENMKMTYHKSKSMVQSLTDLQGRINEYAYERMSIKYGYGTTR
jgi:hypothetical protein